MVFMKWNEMKEERIIWCEEEREDERKKEWVSGLLSVRYTLTSSLWSPFSSRMSDSIISDIRFIRLLSHLTLGCLGGDHGVGWLLEGFWYQKQGKKKRKREKERNQLKRGTVDSQPWGERKRELLTSIRLSLMWLEQDTFDSPCDTIISLSPYPVKELKDENQRESPIGFFKGIIQLWPIVFFISGVSGGVWGCFMGWDMMMIHWSKRGEESWFLFFLMSFSLFKTSGQEETWDVHPIHSLEWIRVRDGEKKSGS